MTGGWIAHFPSPIRCRLPLLGAAVTVGLSAALTACTTVAHSPTIDAPAAATGPESMRPAVAQWPEARSCAAMLRELAGLDPTLAHDLDPMTAPVVVAPLGAEPLSVRADLPIPVVTTAGVASSPCTILVGAATSLPTAADVVLGRQTVHSAYPTGTKRRRNPEHQALERELAATRRGAESGIDVLSTGDPLLDLIGTVTGGVIGGIGAVAKRSDIRAVEAALIDTPAFIEDPILTPYRYELVELEAQRRLAVPVALFDRDSGRALETTITLAEQRRFAIGDGRHPADGDSRHAADATPITGAELAAWRRAGPPITTGMLVAHLVAAASTTATEPTRLEASMTRLASPFDASRLAAAPTPLSAEGADRTDERVTPTMRLAAVDAILAAPEPSAGRTLPPADLVRVGAGDHAGFYVTADHIVVPAAALGHSSLVAVRYADNMRAHGLVELVDETLGLALVYLPRPGTALPLHPASHPTPMMAGEFGLPWRHGDAVIGLFVTDPTTTGPRWIDSPTLGRLVASLDRL